MLLLTYCRTTYSPSHYWYTALATYFLLTPQCLQRIGEEGTEKSNTFARSVWNNAQLLNGLKEMLVGYWLASCSRGDKRLTQLRSVIIANGLQDKPVADSKFSKEKQHKNHHLGLVHRPTWISILTDDGQELSGMMVTLCCSCSHRTLVLNFSSYVV